MAQATYDIVETPVCSWCGNTGWMKVDAAAYDKWQRREILIQDAFPNLTNAEREQLKTGYHGKCWDVMFGGME